MAITRTITYWTHYFASHSVEVHLIVTDDVEGTTSQKTLTYPDSVLPADLAAWEQQVATNKGAVLG